MPEPADPNPKAEGERAQQHEGLYSADARRRYDAAVELGKQSDVAAVPRLIELLADDGTTARLDEWVPLYEEEPEVGRVADAALAALRSMAASAWPALVAALPI